MHLESLLKDVSIEDFTCDLCNNILSYFPIYLTSDCQNVCGRCSPPLGNLHFRNTIFEILSQSIKFPCRFKDQGCEEELLPAEVPEHETCCEFRTIQCSLLECKWEGACPNFLEHCKDSHIDMFLKVKESFEVDLTTPFHFTKLLTEEDTIFVSEMIFHLDKKMLQIAIYYPEHEIEVDKKYLCQLCLQIGTNYPLAHFYATSFENISFTDVYPNLGENRLRCHISLEETTQGTKSNKEQQTAEDNKQLQLRFLSVLECLSCKTLAMPPIYYCSVNEKVLCSSCVKNHSCLNYCRRDDNVALDDLASWLNYPCKNSKLGCDFVGLPFEIDEHCGICPYESIACPLLGYKEKCAWNGYKKDIENHIEVQHQSLISSTFCNFRVYFYSLDCLILRHDDRLFFVEFVKENNRYYWKVQKMPHQGRDKIVKYMIEISGLYNRKVMISNACSKLEKNNSTSRSSFDYVNTDQVGEFDVDFKVTILSSE